MAHMLVTGNSELQSFGCLADAKCEQGQGNATSACATEPLYLVGVKKAVLGMRSGYALVSYSL